MEILSPRLNEKNSYFAFFIIQTRVYFLRYKIRSPQSFSYVARFTEICCQCNAIGTQQMLSNVIIKSLFSCCRSVVTNFKQYRVLRLSTHLYNSYQPVPSRRCRRTRRPVRTKFTKVKTEIRGRNIGYSVFQSFDNSEHSRKSSRPKRFEYTDRKTLFQEAMQNERTSKVRVSFENF